jgi:vacuolar-type H+-ATPase subunit I/STV1
MKKTIAAFLAIFGMTAFFLANGMEEPAHAKKSKEEIEIMKGILNTTLSYAAQSLSQRGTSTASSKTTSAYGSMPIKFSKINAFQLAGQGVVFVIPTASLRTSGLNVFSEDFGENLSWQIDNSLASSMEEAADQVALAKESLEAIRKAPDGQDSSTLKREELRKKRAEEIQAKRQKRRDEEQAKRQKFLQNLAEIKSRLIETLANYGDSFTTIKPDEYINLALTSENGFGVENDQSSYQTISIKRSWITDYKAGRLTLDSFKQKVLNYSE